MARAVRGNFAYVGVLLMLMLIRSCHFFFFFDLRQYRLKLRVNDLLFYLNLLLCFLGPINYN